MGLLRKEEKLLRRLFQKRRNDLESNLNKATKNLMALKDDSRFMSTSKTIIARYRAEIAAISALESRVFKELYKHETTDDTRKTAR